MNSRPQRNLLLLIDGKKADETLLASVTGTSAADLVFLRDLGLITSPDFQAPSQAAAAPFANGHAAPNVPNTPINTPINAPINAPATPVNIPIDIPLDLRAGMPNFGHVSKTLTSLIASELGLRGFTLTLAVERASGIDALLDVADRVVHQIETRKGAAAADKARRALFGQ